MAGLEKEGVIPQAAGRGERFYFRAPRRFSTGWRASSQSPARRPSPSAFGCTQSTVWVPGASGLLTQPLDRSTATIGEVAVDLDFASVSYRLRMSGKGFHSWKG